jgi:Tol biopolymer transport system component
MHSTAAGESLLTITDKGSIVSSEPLPVYSPADSEISVSSASQFAVSPDGKYIAIVIDTYDSGLVNFSAIYEDGGYGALFVIDRANRTAKRISPRNHAVHFSKPVWFPDSDHLLFTSMYAPKPLKPKAKITSDIFKISRDGTGLALQVRNAESPFLTNK